MVEEEHVSLENLGHGAAVELFDTELQRVLENIQDENTKPTAIRQLTLTLKIKPEEDRSFAKVEMNATSKLAAVRPFPSMFYFGKKDGQAVATEHTPQRGLFEPPKAGENVVPMVSGKEAASD
jgi:hypothetical protein